jgi:hypothetical protein
VKFTSLLLLAILALSFIAAPAHADTIAITDPSFESPLVPPITGCGGTCAFTASIPGWMISPGGIAGQFQPGSSAFFTVPLPDGNTVAYSNGSTISQTLSATLAPNTTYTLSVDVGRRVDASLTNFEIDLLAGGNIFAFQTFSNGFTPGTFALESLSFTTGANVLPGQQLGIAFSNPFPVQLNYDNVQLSASPVPEPGSLALLATGLGLFVLVLRRR